MISVPLHTVENRFRPRMGHAMIRQRVGDLLEIDEAGRHYYFVVLTGIVLFGGNIVFAFHNDGRKREAGELATADPGFNICTDLLLPKREGRVKRLGRFADVSAFWRTRFVKATNEYRPGVKAKEWFIHRADDLGGDPIARVTELTPEYRAAMDSGSHSFDLVAEKVLSRYTPDRNELA